ncbi:helix-turn-helix domain-containing protein [Duganella sp. FT94W]|uniref:Helix-turn-helix domain-containing protein n=1 Tax=Duganella lactea TaxID=2692173 RepID=A0ABW9V862_9BURK|nr:helix-turn-helix transcriptional regulator [Duganella lactea]MYM34899.1 helix-turn-helix domain-containing protein [Duganella lactea]
MQNFTPQPNWKLKDRLAWARAQKGMTQQELAAASKVAQSTIASWENGARETGRKITALAEPLGVDELWLATGKGEPIKQARQVELVTPQHSPGLPEQLQAQIMLGHLNEREAVLIHKYRMATAKGRKLIDDMSDAAPKEDLFVVRDQAKS